MIKQYWRDRLTAETREKLHEAFKAGSLEQVEEIIDHKDFPNCAVPGQDTSVLEYALYHSPLPMIRALLDRGAKLEYEWPLGFASIVEVLTTDREDKHELLELLLDHGADVNQHGVNDYTPLHMAAVQNDAKAIEILLAHGADPEVRTRVDDYATPLEELQYHGLTEAAATLKRALKQRKSKSS